MPAKARVLSISRENCAPGFGWSFAWLVGAGIVAAAASAHAQPVAVPPVNAPATQEHHPGKVIFEELITPDLAGAKAFYGNLFGWTFQDANGLRFPYSQATIDGLVVGGIVQKPLPASAHLNAEWLNYISVQDVDKMSQAAVSAGAKLLVPPHEIPGRGREAVVSDPQGAVFAVLSSSSGDPADSLVPLGGWIWDSVGAKDPAADANFYRSLFGYEVDAYPDSTNGHSVLATENYARASINVLPPNRPNAHPHWLGYVRVASVSQATAKATSLGGRVLAGPWTDRHGGMMAVLADPQGAPFGIMEWADTDSKEVGQ